MGRQLTRLERVLVLLGIALLVVAWVDLLAGCGASQREKTIKATLTTVNTVRDGFVDLDGRVQTAIVETATTREEGASRLALYRTKRDVVVQAFATVYRAIATAATTSDDPSVANMLAAARQLEQLVDAIRKDISP